MTALLALPMSLALACAAPGLGWANHLLLAVLLTLMLGTGQCVCRAFGYPDEPFFALVAGFVLIAYALVLADLVVPGASWPVAAMFVLPAAVGFFRTRRENWRAAMTVTVGVALFTLAWNLDLSPRLTNFYSTGRLNFWVDVLVHAGHLAGFAAPDAIGRGTVLMADMAPPLYHYASLMPTALLATLTGTRVLDATVLIWIPLGILIMACGVAALGATLGGPCLSVLALAALAFIPAPERLTLDNGFLGFAWLIDTSPGTAYSLGVACAALAALIRWTHDQRHRTLVLAAALVASCFLVRANTFVWLAPAAALGAVAGWRRATPRSRLVLVGFSVLGSAIVLTVLSWTALRADAMQFLFGYVEYVNRINGPTRFDNLYPAIVQHLGRAGAGIIGVGLTLLGILGPWLPAFVILGLLAWRRKLLGAADALPWLLLVVAALAMLMAPMAPDGDITEFRHRPGPLLVVVLSVWSMRFVLLLAAPLLERTSARRRQIFVGVVAVVSLAVLATSIDAAKRPRMAWGTKYYGTQVAPELILLAPLLSRGGQQRPRFAVANQPADVGTIDDAARLVAFSGVPAYISSPVFLLKSAGRLGDEARRRMAVIARLAEATDLAELQATMRAEGITHYVVTAQRDAPFDPERRGAIGRAGTYAIYLAVMPVRVSAKQ